LLLRRRLLAGAAPLLAAADTQTLFELLTADLASRRLKLRLIASNCWMFCHVYFSIRTELETELFAAGADCFPRPIPPVAYSLPWRGGGVGGFPFAPTQLTPGRPAKLCYPRAIPSTGSVVAAAHPASRGVFRCAAPEGCSRTDSSTWSTASAAGASAFASPRNFSFLLCRGNFSQPSLCDRRDFRDWRRPLRLNRPKLALLHSLG